MFNKKNIFIAVSVFIVLGLVSGIAFANEVIINGSKENIELKDAAQEDVKGNSIFDEMVEIMNENGYGAMGDMMESVGREDMIQMHETIGQYHMNNGFSGGEMMGRQFRR